MKNFALNAKMTQRLNILCFGASLVAGYTSSGRLFTPFSKTLKSILHQHFGDSKDIITTTDGLSGQRVVSGFRERMAEHCEFTFLVYNAAKSRYCMARLNQAS